jgi:hypothetical protein
MSEDSSEIEQVIKPKLNAAGEIVVEGQNQQPEAPLNTPVSQSELDAESARQTS